MPAVVPSGSRRLRPTVVPPIPQPQRPCIKAKVRSERARPAGGQFADRHLNALETRAPGKRQATASRTDQRRSSLTRAGCVRGGPVGTGGSAPDAEEPVIPCEERPSPPCEERPSPLGGEGAPRCSSTPFSGDHQVSESTLLLSAGTSGECRHRRRSRTTCFPGRSPAAAAAAVAAKGGARVAAGAMARVRRAAAMATGLPRGRAQVARQRLTLVHFSPQLEPCLTQ